MPVSVRRFAAAAALAALAVAAPCFAKGDAPAGAGPMTETTLLAGAWDCTGSGAASASEEFYRRTSDTGLALTSLVRTGTGATGSVEETFRFDRHSGVWSLDAGKNRFYDTEHLEAPAWEDRPWTFKGTEATGGKSHPVRVIYSYAPPDSFLREHEILVDGHWRHDGTFVCRRAPLEARFDAEAGVPGDAPRARRSQVPQPGSTGRAAPRIALAVKPPPSPQGPTAVDHAYDLTHGVWGCKTFGGADATHTYTREPGNTIVLHNVLNIGSRHYAIDELYRFDPVKKAWTTMTSGDAYAGVAGRWLSDKWVFVGDMPLGGRRVPVEMIYSWLGDRAFRRDFIRVQNQARATFAAETCQRR